LYEYNVPIIVETDLLMHIEIETIKHNTNRLRTLFLFSKTLVFGDPGLTGLTPPHVCDCPTSECPGIFVFIM